MAKRIALSDFISVDAVELSNFARSVRFTSEHERIDVSGFNPTGANEYLAGQTTQSCTVEFFGSYGTGEVHATLYPIHQDREVVPFAWRPDMNSAVSATNPELRGNVQVLAYSPGGTRGEADTFEVEFTAADEDGLAFVIAAEMAVRVRGMAELNRAMARAPKTLKREYRAGQRRLAEPVRASAESRAMAIGNVHRSPEWGRMRSGATTKVVYVAPRKRGTTGRKRRNLAGLLMDRAMQPALDQHEAQIAREFDGFLRTMERDWAR